MTAVTRDLSEFTAALRFDALPAEVVERSRLLALDHVGIALRARHAAALNDAMTSTLSKLGLASGSASVIGDERGYAPPAAALYNGNLAHSLDFDDTHARGSIHPSAPIVPAAFAAAEMAGANGHDLIAGIVAGYETQIRLSLALVPSRHYARGFHPTATCGTFGAAAAAGRVLGLDPLRMQSAFGLSGSLAGGSMQFLDDGSWNKRFHTGYAALNGLTAAVAAAEDYRGAAAAIEGRAGFLSSYSPSPEPARAVEALGDRFRTLEIAVKPYPCCRYSHAALDAIIALCVEHDIAARDVVAVEVGLPLTGQKIIGEPLEAKQHPHNVVDGQFSMPFVAAVALRERRMAWDDYARHLTDPETLALCKRVSSRADPIAEAEFPRNMSASVRIATTRGTWQAFVPVPKGEPANFMSDAELGDKFHSLCAPYIAAPKLTAAREALASLERRKDVRGLLEPLSFRSRATSRPATR